MEYATMYEAKTTHTTTRRLFGSIASSAALSVFTPAGAAAAVGHSSLDAELIRLADEILALEAETNRLGEIEDTLPDWQTRHRFNAENIRPLVDRGNDLRLKLVQIRATTMGGFRAKARVLQVYNNCQPGFAKVYQDDALSWSLANDLLGVASVWRAEDEGEDEG
jgi:hypothetical protein